MEIYPEIDPTKYKSPYREPRFYVEFYQGVEGEEKFRIMMRTFILSEDEYSYYKNLGRFDWGGHEGHGYNMLNGTVAFERSIYLTTKHYLKYLVDALNDKFMKENYGN